MTAVKQAALFLAVLSLGTCAVACDPTPVLLKGVATTSVLVAGGYRALDAADEIEQVQIRQHARSNPQGAQIEMSAYLVKYNKAAVALDTALRTTETVLDSVPVIKAAHDKKTSLTLLGQLATIYADVIAALVPLGIQLPAFGSVK